MSGSRNLGDYLHHLHQLNAARKRKQAEEGKKHLPVVAREEGFQLYFKGANRALQRPEPLPKDTRPVRRKWQVAVDDPFETNNQPNLLERIENLEPEDRMKLAKFIESLKQ